MTAATDDRYDADLAEAARQFDAAEAYLEAVVSASRTATKPDRFTALEHRVAELERAVALLTEPAKENGNAE